MSFPKTHPFAQAMALAIPALCLHCGQALAQEAATLPVVTVNASKISPLPGATPLDKTRLAPKLSATSDTASLLSDVPGLSLNGAGGVSSLPAINGLADDRLRIQVDGMDLIASCPNHMNPALSYIDPTQVGLLKVYAGITPVSAGGDSIGGSIVAESGAPEFAAPGQAALAKGEAGTFYRSNNKASGVNLSAIYATEQFNISYSGASSQADNTMAGADFKSYDFTGRPGHTLARDEVGSTAFETLNHSLGLAFKKDNHLTSCIPPLPSLISLQQCVVFFPLKRFIDSRFKNDIEPSDEYTTKNLFALHVPRAETARIPGDRKRFN